MITIEDLTIHFGQTCVLNRVSTSIDDGEVVSIIGPSGTGKSTLLRCINRLEEPDGGSIVIDGNDILAPGADVAAMRRQTGMVFQSFNLFEHLSVLENLTIGPVHLLKQKRAAAVAHAHDLLRTVGLSEKASSMPYELSGGQKQRVAIARCLSMQPNIILFDEPTSALDPTMVSEVLAVIRRLAREGLTMLIVTHELGFAHDVSHRIFYMDEGGIYESGDARQIMESPQREKTKTFINRLRNFTYPISARDFDVFGMNAEIEMFCEKHFLTQRMTHHVLLAVEEALAIFFAKAGREAITLTLSYGEKDGLLEIIFDDQQPSGNFIEQTVTDDDLALAVLKGIVHDIRWQPMPDGNHVSMTLNEKA